MGDARLPLYAYVDETGNTGHNLFDEAQPDFFTAALITKGDFDRNYDSAIKSLCDRLNIEALHGRELGVAKIESVSQDFLRILRSSQAAFFVSRVEKKYLLATKVFDTIFDSGENAAVAWHHYNIRPLRLTLAFKLARVVTEKIARQFWKCILEKEHIARAMLPEICSDLLLEVSEIADTKARETFTAGLEWAKAHPESIQISVDQKLAKQAHFPNMVAFSNLLDGLEIYSKRTKKRVARITHDQQSEFEKTLAACHALYSNASPEDIQWAGETYSLQKVVGSEFSVKTDAASVGIQVADLVLWLYSQFRRGKELPEGCLAILKYVFSSGWENDFSFEGVNRVFNEKFGEILATPISQEREGEAKRLLAEFETSRLKSIARYEEDHLPPFMRSEAKAEISNE